MHSNHAADHQRPYIARAQLGLPACLTGQSAHVHWREGSPANRCRTSLRVERALLGYLRRVRSGAVFGDRVAGKHRAGLTDRRYTAL